MKTKILLAIGLALSATACSRMTNGDVNSVSGAEGNQEVELASGGLSTGSQGLHHANMIEFGSAKNDVVAQISAILGRPTTGRNAECPTGAVDYAQYGPLQLNFENGRFAGWVVEHEGGPLLESYHGLSVGDRRSELDGDVEIEVQANSTLGTELSINGIGALLDGSGPNSKVTTLFAGTTCFAR
jgi:hypothetical protein